MSTGLRFGELFLDPIRRELRNGSDMLVVQPQVFDLLEFLIRNRHRVVSRDDLLAGVWGGRIVSDSAIAARINAARRVIGDDGTQQRWIRTIARKGFRFVGEVQEVGLTTAEKSSLSPQAEPAAANDNQRISFCRTVDGVSIAVARKGSGLPVVCVPNWGSIEYDWLNPTRAELWSFLAQRFELIRYDGRGFGLSDRHPREISLTTFERDLDAVVSALGLGRYALFAVSDSCAAAISHAAANPERATKLVIHCGIAQGAINRELGGAISLANVYATTMGNNWDAIVLSVIRTQLSSAFPGLSGEQVSEIVDLLPRIVSLQVALRHLNASAEIDVVDQLAQVRSSTLVLHCRDCSASFFEQAHRIATEIPNAELLNLETDNFVPLPGEAAWQGFAGAIAAFLSDD